MFFHFDLVLHIEDRFSHVVMVSRFCSISLSLLGWCAYSGRDLVTLGIF